MRRSADIAKVLKGFVMIAGQLSLIGLAIASFVTGYWILGLVVLFVGVPLWLFVSDLLTGLLIAPVILLAEKPWRWDKDAGGQRIPSNGYQRYVGESEQLRLDVHGEPIPPGSTAVQDPYLADIAIRMKQARLANAGHYQEVERLERERLVRQITARRWSPS
jgi:hypothetical protein